MHHNALIARTLPGHVFYDEDWYHEEVKHLLEPSWILAGRAEELPMPGSYLKLDMPGGASAIVVRGKDHKIRAWANVCTHRGARLVQDAGGKFSGGITCPYHAWTFDATSGALKGVPKPKLLPECFDKKEWPLREVRLEESRGFLFVTPSDATPPLEVALGNIGMAFDHMPLSEMVSVGRREYQVDCNWKFLMQNTSETYHTSFVHKDSLGPMPSEPIHEYSGQAPVGMWEAVHVPGERSIVPMPNEVSAH